MSTGKIPSSENFVIVPEFVVGVTGNRYLIDDGAAV